MADDDSGIGVSGISSRVEACVCWSCSHLSKKFEWRWWGSMAKGMILKGSSSGSVYGRSFIMGSLPVRSVVTLQGGTLEYAKVVKWGPGKQITENKGGMKGKKTAWRE